MYVKDKVELEITYSSLSGKRRVKGSLSLTALCPARRGSIYRWLRGSKLGLAFRLKLGRTLLTRCRNVRHFHFLLPIRRIITGMPRPPSTLLTPLKNDRPILLLGIC